MNLEALFRDYEARLAAVQQQNVEADAQDTHIAEFGKITHLDRLAGQIGQSILVHATDDRKWLGNLESVGYGWCQMGMDLGSLLIPASSILWWEGGRPYSSLDSGEVPRKLSYAFALRALSKYHAEIKVFLAGGHEVEGVLHRVGADFIEIKTSPSMMKGSSGARRLRVLPLANIVAVITLNW